MHEQIYHELKEWTEAEMAFREAELVKTASMPLEVYLEKYKNNMNAVNIALYPERAEAVLCDQEFIESEKNVGVMKHGRGMPLYFHDHSFFEMIYVLEGTCTQYFEESSMDLNQGDFCLLSPGVRHAVLEDGTALILNVLIRYDTFMDIFMNTVRDKSSISEFFLGNLYSSKGRRTLVFHTGSDVQIKNYVLDLYEEQKAGDIYSDRISCSLMTILFAQLVRRFQATMDASEMMRIQNENVIAMIHSIIEKYNNVTIEELASEYHYSRQYCSRLIRETTGKTFQKIVTDIRVEKGKQYLRYSNLDMAQISERIGYANPETFVRLFKKRLGMTPGQFRKHFR